NNLSLFERNSENGKLKLIQKDFAAPEVVCVYFK
ncbi:beta-propeller fold lactonase family protein, partial [Pediococcus acidilactici]